MPVLNGDGKDECQQEALDSQDVYISISFLCSQIIENDYCLSSFIFST